MPPLAAFMDPQLAAVVWVDYRRTALIPPPKGLGVVPTSVGIAMQTDSQARATSLNGKL